MPLHAAAEELCVSAANLAKLFRTRGRGMGMSGSSTTWGNKMWVGTKMGPRKLFKSLSHIVSIQLNISLL